MEGTAAPNEQLEIFSFGEFEVDTAQLTIRRDGVPVAIEPQVFDVLRFLLVNRRRVVSKEELLDSVWGDRFVSESALTSRVKSIRRALGDDGKQQHTVRTVHGRGYQFVADVRLHAGGPSVESSSASRSRETQATFRVAPPAKKIIGRQAAVDRVGESLAPGKVTTIVGPAGVGKTHLAREVGSTTSDHFPDGGWFVQLAEVRDPGSLIDAVAQAIGQPHLGDRTNRENAAALIGDQQALLVLDNCEHLLGPARDFVEEILTGSTRLTVLATSRRRLDVAGERVVDLAPLDDVSSRQLFVQRAEEIGMVVELDDALVVDICARLDHLPLALELASARLRSLGLQTLVSLLGERLELLDDGDAVGASRGLGRAIADSYEALDDGCRQTLSRFSLFAGSFDLAAAGAVARAGTSLTSVDAVRQLVELTEQSMVTVEHVDGEARYRLLESIRLFAAEQLQEPEAAMVAHVAHYRASATSVQEKLLGRGFDAAWLIAGRDWPNIRAALDNALTLGLLDAAEELLAATVDYAELANQVEHITWSERTIEAWPADRSVPSRLSANLVRLIAFHGRGAELAERLSGAGEPRDHRPLAVANWWLGLVTGDPTLQAQCLELLTDMTDHDGGLGELQTIWFRQLAATLLSRDDDESSERGRIICQRPGDVGRAYGLMIEASEALRAGDLERCLTRCSEQIVVAERCGAHALVVIALVVRGIAISRHARPVEVLSEVRDSLVRYRLRGLWTLTAIETGQVAVAAATVGRFDIAARIIAARGIDGVTGGHRHVEGRLEKLVSERADDGAFQRRLSAGRPASDKGLCDDAIRAIDELINP